MDERYNTRYETKKIKLGNIYIGGGSDVSVQTMLNMKPDDIEGNIKQAIEAQKSGAEIIRVAIPNKNSVKLIEKIKENINIPLVADIHFDYKLALLSADAGVDKIRINPGNIGGDENVRAVAEKCREKDIPIRIGVNSGSIEKEILEKYGHTPEALFESGMYHVKLLNKFDFDDIIVALKSSNVRIMVEAYRLMAQKTNYPLHLGITESGTYEMGVIKSSIGIGSLLVDGIGDTIRVSLTEDLSEEIRAGYNILKSLGLKKGVDIISCPTCGRTEINLIPIAKKVEKLLENETKNIQVAVMGCAVNGPGEASHADIGIAGNGKNLFLFKKGEVIGKFTSEEEILNKLMAEIKTM